MRKKNLNFAVLFFCGLIISELLSLMNYDAYAPMPFLAEKVSFSYFVWLFFLVYLILIFFLVKSDYSRKILNKLIFLTVFEILIFTFFAFIKETGCNKEFRGFLYFNYGKCLCSGVEIKDAISGNTYCKGKRTKCYAIKSIKKIIYDENLKKLIR